VIANTQWLDFNDAADAITRVRFDRDDLRARLLGQLEAVLASLYPHGRIVGHEFVVGDLSGARGDSLRVELRGSKRGVWIDHATGECGDVLDLWSHARRFDIHLEFAEMLADIAAWLQVPTEYASTAMASHHADAKAAPAHREPPLDTLGMHTAKWDYRDTNGRLIACVYRYDTPEGKTYRPWDARRRQHGAPSPRPLYNLPGIAQSDTVVLVEGEKCAQALIDSGVCATTAMHGAKAPTGKTDWTPLRGKTVIVWPDHDAPGREYADAVIPHLHAIGARSVRRVRVPVVKAEAWDAADALADGTDVVALLETAEAVPPASLPPETSKPNAPISNALCITDWLARTEFGGPPAKRSWLVEGVFPLGQPALVAAAGGVGKSYLLLELARDIAAFDGLSATAPVRFGGAIAAQGAAVYITAEDDRIEAHNRLHALGDIPDRLYVIPLPDAGGAVPLFAPHPQSKAPAATGVWHSLDAQLRVLPDVRLIVLDPLQPLCALDLNVPENAQFVCSRLAALAAATGAAVIVSHHFAKREAATPEQAREAIRGTGGLVDGVRSVYALWPAPEAQAKAVARALDLPFERNGVVCGGVVKANGRANLRLATFVRDARGVLVDRTDDLRGTKAEHEDLLPLLRDAVVRAAAGGQPYTKTGNTGVHERRFELPEPFHGLAKHALPRMIETLLARAELVQAMASGSRAVKWLDAPDGSFATGSGRFVAGHVDAARGGRRRSAGASGGDDDAG
jgi:hypothetical protein